MRVFFMYFTAAASIKADESLCIVFYTRSKAVYYAFLP